MDLDQILFQVNHSPTMKLLRSRHAPLTLGFFKRVFKDTGRLQISYSQLKELLGQFIEHLDEPFKESLGIAQGSQPSVLLDLWCNDEHRFLRKYYELNQDEPMTELTYDTERALEWVQGLGKTEFVGTQSRFISIFDNMKRIVDQTDTNPESRLVDLKDQRKKIETEIKQIQATGIVHRMDGTQIRERFIQLLEESRRLISEFRLVEDIFKELTRRIKEEKLKESSTKGDILRQVLDAYDYLEESDQGKSFNAFWNFLVMDENQIQLKELTEKILEVSEVRSFIQKNPDRHMDVALRKLKNQLLQVGQKVLRSKVRLSEELRKLLHQKALAENKRILEITTEIKKLLIENKNFFLKPSQTDFITLFDCNTIQMPLCRPLWQPNTKMRFALGTLSQDSQASSTIEDEKELETWIKESKKVSEEQLEKQIALLLRSKDCISLDEVIKKFPLQDGLTEILSYLNIALKSHRALLNFEQEHEVELLNCWVTLPSVLFFSSTASQLPHDYGGKELTL